jgi:DNA-binding MarR family transcriptional regulator
MATSRPAKRPAGKQDVGTLSLGMLEDAVGYRLRLAQDASFQNFAARIGSGGMRPGRFTLLLMIDENPNLNQKALSLVSGRDKSTTSLLLRDLEKKGLVTRTRPEKDRRRAILHLTSLGKAQLAQMKIAARRHEAELDAIIGDGKEELLALLKRLAAELGSDGTL